MPFSTTERRTVGIVARGRVQRWLVPVIWAFCIAAFISDLLHNATLAYGVAYLPLIATAVVHRRCWGLWALTALTITLVIVGACSPLAAVDRPEMIGNRILSILAILVTASFIQYARTMQDRLAAETRRAEAAERIKTDVFSNLSQEMRTPLHALMGVLSLMMLDCRTDQRAVLARVRAGGRQLLSTIDTLIDLTQLDSGRLVPQPIDMTAVLQAAATAARGTADDDGVTISLQPGSAIMAFADPWAAQRILDNLIAGAIRGTLPDGTVFLSVAQVAGLVITTISNTGDRLPPALPDAALPTLTGDSAAGLMDRPAEAGANRLPPPEGVGLTLSRRLAQAMNGSLLQQSLPETGTVISLRLPAVSMPQATETSVA